MAVRRPFLLFLLVAFAAIATATDEAYGNRPRGVSAEKASLYEEAEEFQCLDGSKKIPFDRVNDDYCDCADGSDEPGTSACPNGRFHCRNHGFRPMELPSSRVNDFVCDCCDGSDEWDSGVQCPNVCHEMGAQARQAADERKAIVEKGWAKRSELAKEGAKSMDEKRAELEKMKKELDDLQPLKSAAEQAKQDAEQRENDAKNEEDRQWNEQLKEKRKTEADELWAKIDVDKDGKISIDDFKAAAKTLAERELDDEDIRSIFGEELELLAEKFREKLLDLRRFFRKLTTERPTAVTEPPPTEEPRSPPPEGEEPKDADVEADDLNDDSLEPEPVRDERDEEDDGDRFDERKPDYSEATRNLIEEANKQRDHHRETTNKIHDLERDIRDAENFLEFEYGPDGAWAPLKGQCPEMNQAQYTYRLCLFDRAVQKDRNGHHEIGIGNWRGWDGPESDKYTVQKYADGQHCWNGPARSTRVHVECGAELELYDVKEPAKCEYEFRLRSPAACPDPATLKDPFAVHTEL